MSAPTDDGDAAVPPSDASSPRAVVLLRPSRPWLTAFDVSVGAGMAAWSVAARVSSIAADVARPVAGLVMRPPLVPRSWTPDATLGRLARHGATVRVGAGTDAEAVSRVLVPAVTDVVLDRIDLTELVLSRVDLARVVEAVLDRMDLTALVLERVDVDRIVASVDLDAAAARLDVDAVARRLDVDAVAARMDLVGIANYIVDAIDLPEIVRTSTGSVATEAIRGVRMQSVDADTQLQSVVDRVLLRRRARRTEAPVDEDQS